jgi:ligand-binding SRPBCC domain-containing protein
MATFSLSTVQVIPAGLEDIWSYFSDAGNLGTITPPDLRFALYPASSEVKMYPGQILEYRVRPIWGIPVYWMTEITHVEELVFFVDEQRFGPYQLWHHQHHFKIVPGGVEMTDLIHYRIPFGLLGVMANELFVEKKLRGIFEFRYKKIKEIFGTWPRESTHSIEFMKKKK